MLRASNMLTLLKTLKLPVDKEVNLNLDYIAHHIWHQNIQKVYSSQNEINDNEKLEKLKENLERTSSMQDELIKPSENDFWVFGYGSLIWKADFPYIDKKKGFIKGYQRRFYQESIDHRGTREQPGRVVTLVPSEQKQDRVYGVAYRIPAQIKNDVIKHLDYREKNGYEKVQLIFNVYPEYSAQTIDLVMYVASKENDSYAGDIWQVDDIAKQILISAGPSGPNREYLFNLCKSMKVLFPDVEDVHLYDLERKLKELIEKEEANLLQKAIEKQLTRIIEMPELNEKQIEAAVNQISETLKVPGGKESYLRGVVQLRRTGTA